MTVQKASAPIVRPQSPPRPSLELQAEQDARDLDFFASGAAVVGSAVLVSPAAARRIARQLRALASLSREAVV